MGDEEWADLLDRQHRVATSAQCAAAGIDSGRIARRVADGRWSRPHHGIVVLAAGPPTPEQLVWAALLSIGGQVVASHETALWLADRRRRVPSLVHVAVLDGRAVTPRSGVRVHHLPELGEDRVCWQLSPPRVSVEHTVVDLGRLCRSPLDVVGLVTGAVGSGLTTVERLVRVVAARPRLRHRATWVALLPDVGDGARSALEVADLRNDRAHGLPTGWRQRPVRRDGRKELLDVSYAVPPPGRHVVKELDGRLWHAPEDKHRDMGRDNAAVLRHGLPLRFGWPDMVGLGCTAAAMLALVLQGRGGPECRSGAGPRAASRRRCCALPGRTASPSPASRHLPGDPFASGVHGQRLPNGSRREAHRRAPRAPTPADFA